MENTPLSKTPETVVSSLLRGRAQMMSTDFGTPIPKVEDNEIDTKQIPWNITKVKKTT